MGIEIKQSAETLGHSNENCANPIFIFKPLVYGRGSNCWQVIKEVSVLLENRPEDAGHRKVHSDIEGIRQHGFQFILPKSRRSIPATWTRSRLASVINEQMLGS